MPHALSNSDEFVFGVASAAAGIKGVCICTFGAFLFRTAGASQFSNCGAS